MLSTDHKPRPPRHGVFLIAVVQRFGGIEPSRHRVRNLSARGACLDHAEALPAGAAVTVGDINAVGASVRWVRDGLAGLEFGEPILLERALVKPAKRPEASPASTPLRLKV